MRLIDANEIAEELYELHQETRCTHEPFLAGKSDAYWDAHGMVIEARTIDAIPVEWIHKFCEDDISEDQQMAIEWMLGVWQEEQEAQK